MNTGIINADRFIPKRRFFWQKPDGLYGLKVGGAVRCVVLHPERGASLPSAPDPYHATVRIVRLIGDPFQIPIIPDCRVCNGPCRLPRHLVQRVEFEP